MGDRILSLSVKVNAETGELEVLGAKLKDTGKAAESAGSGFKGLSGEAKGLLSAMLPFASAGAILAFFSSATKGAEEENEALRRLKFGVEATGQSWEAHRKRVLDWSEAIQQASRFSDGEALGALERLVRVTGDVEKAQLAAQLAMGLSVQSGKQLSETQEILVGLINGEERAVKQATKEFGAFVGGAKTAQEALDALNGKLGDAALKTDGYTDAKKRLSSQVGQLKDQVGNGLIPVLTKVAEWATTAIGWVNNLGIVMASEAAKIAVAAAGIAEALNRAVRLDFEGAKASFDEMKLRLAAVEEETVAMVSESEARKTEAIVSATDVRLTISNAAAERERQQAEELRRKKEEEAAKAAAKIASIEMGLDKQIAILNEKGFARKIAIMQAEIAAERQKILVEVEDKKKQAALLDKLKVVELKRTLELQKEEVDLKRTAALDILATSVEAIQVLNSMSETKTREDARRAKFLLALEKSIAIAKAIAAAQSAGPLAAGIAAAQVALITAQFAAQSKAIDEARRIASQNREELKITTELGGGKELEKRFKETPDFGGVPNLGPVDFGGGSGPASSPVVAGGGGGGGFAGGGGGGGGGPGGPIIIQVGGISVNVYPDNLSLDNAEVLLRRLGDEVSRGTVEGITFALRVMATADRFASQAR